MQFCEKKAVDIVDCTFDRGNAVVSTAEDIFDRGEKSKKFFEFLDCED